MKCICSFCKKPRTCWMKGPLKNIPLASCLSVLTVWLNMLYIVCFRLYCLHGFVSGDASPLLSLTLQKTYNMLITSTTNKASYQILTCRCGILQSTLFKEPDDPVGTIGQPVRSALIPNVTVRPNMLYIVCFGPYHPHSFVSGDVSSLLSLTP
jgi:hypothetical protein